jgi:hypothetical protein
MAITVNATAITFNNGTVQTTAGTGTVSSVATGNGLSGGTITTTGTLSVACPTENSVGSYCILCMNNGGGGATFTFGQNKAIQNAGNGAWQGPASIRFNQADAVVATDLTGTWKYLGPTSNQENSLVLGCRVV